MKQTVLLSILIICILSACNQQSDSKPVNYVKTDSTEVKLIYLGTAGWEITDGKTAILVQNNLQSVGGGCRVLAAAE
jgi:hypothetical protein